MTKKSPNPHVYAIVDRLEIELKVMCDLIESVNIAKFHGFYDVTRNFELDFRATGWLYLGAAFDYSSSFFELFLMAIPTKIGHVPHSCFSRDFWLIRMWCVKKVQWNSEFSYQEYGPLGQFWVDYMQTCVSFLMNAWFASESWWKCM